MNSYSYYILSIIVFIITFFIDGQSEVLAFITGNALLILGKIAQLQEDLKK